MLFPDQPYTQGSFLYAAAGSQVYRYDAAGGNWLPSAGGLHNTEVRALVVVDHDGALYAGTAAAGLEGGVFRSRDGGQTWDHIPNDGLHSHNIRALVWQDNLLYAGISGGVFVIQGPDGSEWLQVGSDDLNGYNVPALAVDSVRGGIYAATEGSGIFAANPDLTAWGPFSAGFPSGDTANAFLLDTSGGLLYAGTEHNGVYRLNFNEGLLWIPVNNGLSPDLSVRGLVLDRRNGILYAATAEGIFRSNNNGGSWQSANIGLPFPTEIFSLALNPQDGTLYAGLSNGEIYNSSDKGQTWLPLAKIPDPVPVVALALWLEPSWLTVSYAALEELRKTHSAERDGQHYPWRLGLSTLTGLPVFLRTWLNPPYKVKPDEVSPPIAELLDPTQLRAVFGRRDEDQPDLEQQLAPEPVIRSNLPYNPDNPPGNELPICHFSWRQVYPMDGQLLPVIGGSVRVHGLVEDERVAVTNSYFPIPDDYSFRPEEGEPPDPGLKPGEDGQPALRAAAQAAQAGRQPLRPFLAGLINPAIAEQDTVELRRLLPLVEEELSGWRRWLMAGNRWLLQQRGLAWLGQLSMPLTWRLTGLATEQAYNAVPVPIHGSDLAILPYIDGTYRLVRRFRIASDGAVPWYVEVDIYTGQTLGEPWQPILRAPYYPSAGATANGPTGNTLVDVPNLDPVAVTTLANYVSGMRQADIDANPEVATAAFHVQKLYLHLQDKCGVNPAKLQGPPVPAGQSPNPGLGLILGSAEMGFKYDASLHPKQVHFWASNAQGMVMGDNGELVYDPAKDPEVVMHEFAHGFLWLFDQDAWEPSTLGTASRALQEGYAMYLSRSIAARLSPADRKAIWAQAAYPANKPQVNRTDPIIPNWGNRWKFAGRQEKEPAADLLPLNSYLIGHKPIDLNVYDAGMIWARTLWDLWELVDVDPDRADWLAVQAYPYLHGAVATFEIAAEGLVDADTRVTNMNVAGAEPLWAQRGIAMAEAVHGFAQIPASGVPTTLIAASDAGVWRSDDRGCTWQPNSTLVKNNPLYNDKELTGVVAVAADSANFYAAVMLPPNRTAGNDTQWRPGIFKAIHNATLTWEPIGDWTMDTQDAMPLSMLVLNTGGKDYLLVGTHKGVYTWELGLRGMQTWSSPTSSTSSQNFGALGLALLRITNLSLDVVQAYSLNKIYQDFLPLDSSDEGWIDPLIPFGGQFPRLTSIASYKGERLLVGTLTGLWYINGAAAQQIGNITQPILALAANATHFYYATPDDIFEGECTFQLDGSLDSRSLVVQPLAGFQRNASVVSLHLFSDPANNLRVVLAGTLAHGIWFWSNQGLQWESVNSPSLSRPPIQLADSEQGILSCWATPTGGQIRIGVGATGSATVNDVLLRKVVQPGFPIQNLNPVAAGVYDLNQASPVILLLQNVSGGNRQVTLTPIVGTNEMNLAIST